MTNRFCRYELRSLDVAAARDFYSHVCGESFWGHGLDVVPLPARAAARGVPGYWLGHIGVEDVVPPMYRFLDAGASRLDPPPADGRDTTRVVLRDPFGAVVALAANVANGRADDRVAWHLHSSRDEEAAFDWYAGVLGWTCVERHDLGERGRHLTFAWDLAGPAVGSASDSARRPHVHPQWLYFFPVTSLDAAIERVNQHGGLALRPATTPDGARVVACDDPQGAAFGLYEGPGASS